MNKTRPKLNTASRKLLSTASTTAFVVHLGKNGWTDQAAKHLTESLIHHELIVIRVAKAFTDAAENWPDVILNGLNDPKVYVIRNVGRTLVLYRIPDDDK